MGCVKARRVYLLQSFFAILLPNKHLVLLSSTWRGLVRPFMSWTQRGEQGSRAENGGAMREGVDLENDWHTINDRVFRSVILRQFFFFHEGWSQSGGIVCPLYSLHLWSLSFLGSSPNGDSRLSFFIPCMKVQIVIVVSCFWKYSLVLLLLVEL